MTLGQKIAALRGKMNYSQGDLAEKLNISRQSISKWETDASTPELGKLIQLCDLFRISLDDLVRQDEIPVSKDQTEERMEKVEAAAEPKSIQTQKLVGSACCLLDCCAARWPLDWDPVCL